MSRNRDLEAALLEAIVRKARGRFGLDCLPYVRRVQVRLRLGAKRYGDDAFMRRDNMAELLEETPDVAGYALLELQRLAGDLNPEVRDDLMRVILLGAVADFYARRAARRVREEASS